MNHLKDFLKILGIVVCAFVCLFSFICAFMLMVAGPTLVHTIIGTPVALVLMAGSIFGASKLIDDDEYD